MAVQLPNVVNASAQEDSPMERQHFKPLKTLAQNRKNTDSETSDTNTTKNESIEIEAKKQSKNLILISV